MADIDIVPKHRSYAWLWVVIALVILAVLWFALSGNTRSRATGRLNAPAQAPAAFAVSV